MERLARQREEGELGLLIYVLQWLHVLFAIFWFGSQMYSLTSLQLMTDRLPPDARAIMDRAGGEGVPRRITIFVASGTVLLGTLRGIAGGVLDVLGTAYGITWLTSLFIGSFMVGSILTRRYRGLLPRNVWNSLFFVMFTLMIAMRFGY